MKLIIIVVWFYIHTNTAQSVRDEISYEAQLDNGLISYSSNTRDQSYMYRVETDDGTFKQESGHFEDNNLVVQGSYEYIVNGVKYQVTYVADKDGYHPKVVFGTQVGVAPQGWVTRRPLVPTRPPHSLPQPSYAPTRPPYMPPQPTYTTTRPPYSRPQTTYTTTRPPARPTYPAPTRRPPLPRTYPSSLRSYTYSQPSSRPDFLDTAIGSGVYVYGNEV